MLSVRHVEELSDLGVNPSNPRANSIKPRRQPRNKQERETYFNIQSTSNVGGRITEQFRFPTRGLSERLHSPAGGAGRDVNAFGAAAKPNIALKAAPDDNDEKESIGKEARLFRGVAAWLNHVGPGSTW